MTSRIDSETARVDVESGLPGLERSRLRRHDVEIINRAEPIARQRQVFGPVRRRHGGGLVSRRLGEMVEQGEIVLHVLKRLENLRPIDVGGLVLLGFREVKLGVTEPSLEQVIATFGPMDQKRLGAVSNPGPPVF